MHAFLKAGHYLGYDVGDPNGFVQSGNKKLQKFLLFPLSLSLPSEDHVEIILNLCSLCSRHTSVLLQWEWTWHSHCFNLTKWWIQGLTENLIITGLQHTCFNSSFPFHCILYFCTISCLVISPKLVNKEYNNQVPYSTPDWLLSSVLVFSPYQMTINRGTRWSSARAYLRPALARSNLHVSLNSHVHRVNNELFFHISSW